MHHSEILLELNEVPQREYITPEQMLEVYQSETGDTSTLDRVSVQFHYLVKQNLIAQLDGDTFNANDRFTLSDYWRGLTLKQKVVWYNKP